jgi:formate--tetrahydrofolate ligase
MSLLKINEIAAAAGIPSEYVIPYGFYKAKIDTAINEKLANKPDGKLVLVTAITPTKAGEGKTTTSIALTEGFGKIGQKALLCLREPALGPVFGIKGGATGGGLASVAPSEDINLHFTGDMHALTSSINLISAVIDNSIYQGNPLNIDPDHIVWKRAMDMNDRALREITVGEGEKNGVKRQDGFVITVASEMMAIMCLAKDEEDFHERLCKIIVAYTKDGKASDGQRFGLLPCGHETHEGSAQAESGANVREQSGLDSRRSFCQYRPRLQLALIATKMALKLAPIVVTEAGFAADLGAEKFLDIASRVGELHPDLAVMVATIRALKMHGGEAFENLANEDVDALSKGMDNLETHLENIKKFGLPVIVAINHFETDTPKEIAYIEKWCDEHHYEYSFLDGFLKGGEGSIDLAKKVQTILQNVPSNYHPLYDLKMPLKSKIETICKEVYRAGKVVYEPKALEQLASYEDDGLLRRLHLYGEDSAIAHR